jgi:Polyphosphate kinase 2 (PPK2)
VPAGAVAQKHSRFDEGRRDLRGRDAAGKGGVIKRITKRTSPRARRIAALGTTTERERTQWYFQRYVAHLRRPARWCSSTAAGAIAPASSASWDSARRGVPRVHARARSFERMLVRSEIILIKYWFSVGDAEQERRFHARLTDPMHVRPPISDPDLRAVQVLRGTLPHGTPRRGSVLFRFASCRVRMSLGPIGR